MGNLLGAPVTEKETHEGSSIDHSMQFAVSSMQGWRVHMEDAHIMEPNLYALQVVAPPPSNAASSTQQQPQSVVRKIELPGHALFAVFDGHGGTFAALYAGRNLCRVLSKQPKFVQYAEFELTRPEKERLLTSSSEKSNLARIGLELLEAALCDAFVDLDREIAQALKGVKVADADQPYHSAVEANHNHHHKRSSSSSASATASTTTTTTVTATSTTTMMQGVVVVEEGSVTTTTTTATNVRPLVMENGDVHKGHTDDDDDDSPAPHDEVDDDHEDDNDDDDEDGASPSDSALQLLEEEGDSGTTACVVMVTPTHVLCANAGDSRAVISRLGHKAVPLSYDHKPDDEGEERRIRAAGGYVAGGRVEGDLAVSRGLGDFRFKNMNTVMAATSVFRYGEPPITSTSASNSNSNSSSSPSASTQSSSTSTWTSSISALRGLGNTTNASNANAQHDLSAPPPLMKPGDQKVSPIPDVVIQGRNQMQDEFILVACDGIWDVLTNYEAVQTIAELFREGETSLGLICEEMCDLCLSMGSKDNMTALVVKFPAQKSGTGGGVMARRQLRDEAFTRSNNQAGGGGNSSNGRGGGGGGYGSGIS